MKLKTRKSPAAPIDGSTVDDIPPIRIFISHKHTDEEVASALIDYLIAALYIKPYEIRCTSVPGYGLPFGHSIHERLRKDLDGSLGFVAILTEDSLDSTWVKFELGGAWVKGKAIFPLLGPGLKFGDERLGPLVQQRCISIDRADSQTAVEDALHQLAVLLGVQQRPGGAVSAKLSKFIDIFRRHGNTHASFGEGVCGIVCPVDGQKVTRNIPIRIRVRNMPSNGSLWIALEDVKQGLLWPKTEAPLPREDGEHTINIVEGGQPEPGALRVTIIGVGPAGDSRLNAWVRIGRQMGHYPGLKTEEIPGAIRLASVGNLTLSPGIATY